MLRKAQISFTNTLDPLEEICRTGELLFVSAPQSLNDRYSRFGDNQRVDLISTQALLFGAEYSSVP